MVSETGKPGLRLEARTLPVPGTVSPEAQDFLATLYPHPTFPAPSDTAAWEALVTGVNAGFEPAAARMLAAADAAVETRLLCDVTVHVATPGTLRRSALHLILHGGGWATMGGDYARALAAQSADQYGCLSLAVDYRKPPRNPFPAALNDALTVYRHIRQGSTADAVFVSGPSAGGNLAAALTLMIKDGGLPLPSALGLFTPVVDLTLVGDSLRANLGVDTVAREPMGPLVALYSAGQPLDHPYLSPLFGDLGGFPPTFLQAGTRDVLLSDTVRMHRALCRAGVDTELHVWEAMPHGGFGGFTPEDADVRRQFDDFLTARGL